MPSISLDIRDNSVSALASDGILGGTWEQLRCNGRPTTARDIATSIGLREGDALAQLDRLVALGLAKRLPMTARQRELRFEAIARQLVVRYRLPGDADILRTLLTTRMERSLSAMPRHSVQGMALGIVMRLTESEAKEIRRLIGSIADLLASAGARKPSWRDGIGPPTHALHLGFDAIDEPALPTPHLTFVQDGQQIPGPARSVPKRNGRDLLSPRERQIGAAYVRGLTRKEIAAELGLSENSVATFTKRLYTKLGIKRRGALAARLAEVLG